MNFSAWSIRHPVPPIAIFLVLMLMGFYSFSRLAVTAMPNIDLPLVSVVVSQPGAAPSELTRQVIQPIEDSIASITGVRHITSSATDSSARIYVEFELETDTDRAVNDVKDAVANVRADLPESIVEPLIHRIDISGMAILTYAVSNPGMSIEGLSDFVDDVVSRDLSTVSGVASITRIGGADRQINVELDPDRIMAFGLTAAEISDQLRAKNIDMGGGRGDLAGTEYSIRALGSAGDVARLGATPILIGGGRTVRLDQLGSVTDGASEERKFALLDGQPVVAFGVFRASGESDLEAGDGAKARIAEIEARNPGTRITLIDDATTYTSGSYHSTMETLYEGAALAVVVVFLFLRNWRATLIAAVALPLSIIPTFFVMHWLGFTLNGISLLAITLVTGILVDDAIVEIENIVRHINMGVPAYEASMEAANEIGLTVIAISFSIVAVFAPVSFMGGIPGQYFKQFGLTVAVSVLFSLLVARLITPMLAAYFLRDNTRLPEERDGPVLRNLMAVLAWTLRHRGLTLLMGLGVFAGSIYSATLLPTEFIPASDVGRSQISIELPPGATVSETEAAARMISQRIKAVPEVRSVFVNGGEDDVTKAKLMVNYGPKEERERSSFVIEDELKRDLSQIPDMRINFQNEEGNADLSISVLGDSEEGAADAAERLMAAMKTLPTLEGVTSSASLQRPEIQIHPRPEVAAQLGVTASALATTLRVATLGDTESNLAKFNTGDKQIPIMVRLDESARRDLMTVRNLRVPSSAGQVPLEVVADVSISAGATEIGRYDRRYRTTVSANLAGGALLGPVNAQVTALQGQVELPAGTEIQASGDAEIMAEVFQAFTVAMISGVLLTYVVLVLLFHNFVTPVSILMSLPLAIGGAILALFLTGNSISMAVVIGFLMLMGIVTKNAIMLVEFAVSSMDQGTEKRAAILDAVHKRARPIVMTTIAMTAGMVPSALGTGEGAEFSSPMAIAVIGGLLLSTLLSLLFVPSLFSVIHGGQVRVARWLRRRIGLNAAPEAAGE
ncbi:efflux RND transporter permease subunit [Paracoccus denitrificans]|jgi:hydrophobe/amphiphile efflux-1 (HAE1) family protein|uniref:Acriflavin resistance protein n=1 Tax=Paracoccus denitrificans (strain Pd 1222) TaxID=318586 RepID=A1B8W1_PARDP|nr:efflux RND transporter permease subunit [Paracoccus denitrificans]ABL71955.1 acriflavin resistance protein [Paracoccus denitrificans PD1222]MBB4626141.1 hydrophobe/amphiphile efflux-1 (HAE1) family protein [Paracoccus denitrificans]MCU7430589.1 efflux RND transporter permease subunit [Paracoccus denitrificans]QAR28537.1 efflux RND transporter permease subunit [Paracoccus denitrificans]UPV96680.1 efflux RND transporter permease subunit [Paracoccus denitrificans]